MVCTMKEAAVNSIFAAWLESQGWMVDRSAFDADIVARRGETELRVEVKGDASDRGIDEDTSYGQLLRRMVPNAQVQYALVGHSGAMDLLERVPAFVRWRLGVGLYEVTDDGHVIEHERPIVDKPTRGGPALKLDTIGTGFLVRPDPQCLTLNPFDGVYGCRGYVIPLQEKWDESWEDLDDWDVPRAVASIRWEVARFDEATNARFDFQEVADAHSQLLHDIVSTIWDERGHVRETLNMDGAIVGGDLLHIEEIDVEPAYDFVDTSRLMVEHVLQRFGGGCGFAAYYTDKTPHVQLRPMLLERGFVFVPPTHPRVGGIYVLDMSGQRPRLPEERQRG